MPKVKKALSPGVIDVFENFRELENIFDDFRGETKDVYRCIQSSLKKNKIGKIEMRKIFAKFRAYLSVATHSNHLIKNHCWNIHNPI